MEGACESSEWTSIDRLRKWQSCEDGQIQKELRVDLVHDRLVDFAKTLNLEDEVVIEATGNSAAVERVIRPHVKRVAIANPDGASDRLCPGQDGQDRCLHSRQASRVGLSSGGLGSRRRYVAPTSANRRTDGRARAKHSHQGRIQAILHTNLIPKYSGHLFGKAGRKWLDGLPLPEEERAILVRLVHELERVTAQLAELDKLLAQQALADPRALRLMTIPGVSSVVSSTVLASIGDISRFPTPEKLSSYFGLTPKVRQSGDRPARHGRISKQGNTAARKMLVEAAWSAKTAPGPLRAFFVRVHKKRGAQAAAVATARKLAVTC